MSATRLLVLVWSLVALLLVPSAARGDAVVRTQAMFASTIAEYFIEESGVRVDLEIGGGDLRAFANLLPDALRDELGVASQPLAERLQRFFAHDLAVAADGETLPGRIVGMEPRERPRRDAITGEVLPRAEGEEPETVLLVRLAYPFQVQRPMSLFAVSWSPMQLVITVPTRPFELRNVMVPVWRTVRSMRLGPNSSLRALPLMSHVESKLPWSAAASGVVMPIASATAAVSTTAARPPVARIRGIDVPPEHNA